MSFVPLIRDPVLFRAWSGVVALLVGATLIAVMFARVRPTAETRKTVLRVRTWWIIAGCLFGAMSAGVLGVAVLFLAVSLLAIREFVYLDGGARRRGLALFVLGCGAVLHFVGLLLDCGDGSVWIRAGVILVAIGTCLYVVTRDGGRVVLALSAFLLGVVGMGCVVCLARVQGVSGEVPCMGLRLCFFLLLLTALNDVAQYLWGKGLGRRKVVPSISPNKTWAGLIGGVASTALLAGGVAPFFTLFSHGWGLLAGLLIGGGGFVGDILASAYKRRVGAGESGVMLPGHGGMLDRADSLCLTAPLLYVLVLLY